MTITLSTLFYLLSLLAWLAIGYYIGHSFANKNKKNEVDGIFHVDLSDPEKDTLRMEFLRDLDEVISKDQLCFKVQVDNRGEINDHNRET